MGSQIHKFNINSDVDIVIICSDENQDESVIIDIINISNENNILIHPIILSCKQYNERKNIILYQEMMQQNICIYSKIN